MMPARKSRAIAREGGSPLAYFEAMVAGRDAGLELWPLVGRHLHREIAHPVRQAAPIARLMPGAPSLATRIGSPSPRARMFFAPWRGLRWPEIYEDDRCGLELLVGEALTYWVVPTIPHSRGRSVRRQRS